MSYRWSYSPDSNILLLPVSCQLILGPVLFQLHKIMILSLRYFSSKKNSFLQRCIIDDLKILLTQICKRFQCDSLTLHSSLHMNTTLVTMSSKDPTWKEMVTLKSSFSPHENPSIEVKHEKENKIPNWEPELPSPPIFPIRADKVINLSPTLSRNPRSLTVYSHVLLLHWSNCKI